MPYEPYTTRARLRNRSLGIKIALLVGAAFALAAAGATAAVLAALS